MPSGRDEAFYPAMLVDLRIRFDEALQADILGPPTSTGQAAEPRVLPLFAASPELLALGESTNKPPPRLSFVVGIVPKSATVELPGVRQAGRFNLTFDFRNFPIDPRLLRSAGVEIRFGSVRAGDFAEGMAGVDSGGLRRSILEAPGLAKTLLPLLVGTVDTHTVEHTDRGSEVHMEGRDNRGILLDSPIDHKLLGSLDLSQSIDKVVLEILSKHPAIGQLVRSGRFFVAVQPQDWPDGIVPSPAGKSKQVRSLLSVGGGNPKSAPPGSATKLNYWDLITRYCFLVGAIPYFVGEELRIRPGRAIHDQRKKGLFDPITDPPFQMQNPERGQWFHTFIDRPSVRFVEEDDGTIGEEFTVRRMVYGRNVQRLSFERKFAGVKAPVIEVVSVDTSSASRGKERLLIAQWPPAQQEGRRNASKSPRTTSVTQDGEEIEEKLRISVPGIKSADALREIAKDLYEEIGRSEVGGSCETKRLASLGGDNLDPDMLRLRPGDAVEFMTDTRALSSRAPLVAELVDQQRTSFEEQVQSVMQNAARAGGRMDENLARAIVATARSGIVRVLSFFHVTNVKYDWSNESGIGIAFDFNNFVTPRSDVTPSTGATTEQPKRTAPDRHKKTKEKTRDIQDRDALLRLGRGT